MSAKNGKPCKRCGANDWKDSGDCRPCEKERAKKRRQSDPDKKKVADKNWRERNIEKVRESARKRYEENPNRAKERAKRWKQDNPDKAKNNTQRWRQANQDKVRQYHHKWGQENKEGNGERASKWRRANPDKASAIKHRRRTKKTQAGGSYTAQEFRDLCQQYDNHCLKCGRDDVKLTADHIVPVSKGGSSDISNIQPLCGSCNSSKNDKVADYRTKPGITRWIQRRLFG